MARRVILGESGGPTPVIDWEVAGALDAAPFIVLGILHHETLSPDPSRIKPSPSYLLAHPSHTNSQLEGDDHTLECQTNLELRKSRTTGEHIIPFLRSRFPD